ncbi:hypothetical protein TIFTF001_034314 [Ficus carica]|uniref:Uncharacterized protein n=1 Tax=Ficus carica TaxID=3494 RepID=A0AA88E0Y7_FICCA|nr:hypothetical protein TIFTF001_034314 [Ficus carica]
MALELVGGAFLFSLFQTLFDNLASSEVLDFFRRKKLNPGLLKKLKILLISAEAMLDDVEGSNSAIHTRIFKQTEEGNEA